MAPELPPESVYRPHSARLARWVLDGPAQLTELRSDLATRLGSTGAEHSGEIAGVAEQMVLVANELATNALVHGLPPTVVQLLDDDEELILDVVDHAPHEAPELAEGRPTGQGGLGLHIALRMAMDVGWFAEGSAKHVWARFPRP